MTTLAVAVATQLGAQLRTYATLLPLGVRDLDNTIAREAAENPWLELVDRPVFGLTDADFRIAAAGPSLGEHLWLQLEARGVRGNVLRAAQYVIGSLDQHAYLREDAAQISRLTHIDITQVLRAIALVQGLEPIGVAARSLGERFRLQLAHAGDTASLAFNLTSELEALAAEGHAAFAAQRGLTSAEFSKALRRLRACDPDPARDFGCAAAGGRKTTRRSAGRSPCAMRGPKRPGSVRCAVGDGVSRPKPARSRACAARNAPSQNSPSASPPTRNYPSDDGRRRTQSRWPSCTSSRSERSSSRPIGADLSFDFQAFRRGDCETGLPRRHRLVRTSRETLTGVFFADRPVDENEGARSSEAVILVDVPDALTIGDFELIEELKGYREWSIPAAIVNQWPRRLR